MRKDHMACPGLEDRMFQDVIIALTVGRLFSQNLSPIGKIKELRIVNSGLAKDTTNRSFRKVARERVDNMGMTINLFHGVGPHHWEKYG